MLGATASSPSFVLTNAQHSYCPLRVYLTAQAKPLSRKFFAQICNPELWLRLFHHLSDIPDTENDS
jgi:hypothetical protein